jgi:hypothetical protein
MKVRKEAIMRSMRPICKLKPENYPMTHLQLEEALSKFYFFFIAVPIMSESLVYFITFSDIVTEI